ncbi:MAG: PBECR2 nuclease fold domain-containing protein [Desulfovibrio sp.]|uniref:PBECR2 nuclease fold domain-containing protein n=1 Tax=Desulfovibrio sp. 7SRBS1 TaxID=3378064 RepID=UPI003B41F1CC
MRPSAKYTPLPFKEAIQHFRDKVQMPSETWRDLWGGMHSRAFVVAGATRADVLSDLYKATEKAISQGTTLKEFTADFDAMLQRTGWNFKGGKAWRCATIFNTNLSTAYASGHYRQMSDPDVLRDRPYFRYVESSSAEPRAEHAAWYNVVLPADDPWWDTHYPPKDWGCKCGVVSLSKEEKEELQADGVRLQETPPPDKYYEWTNPDTGEVHTLPVGVGPGWDYHVGKAAWGQRLSEQAMDAWRAQGADAWERLTPGDYKTYGRPAKLPVDVAKANVGTAAKSVAEATANLEHILGGPERVFSFSASGGFRSDVLVNASTLAKHLGKDLARSRFFPLLPEVLEDPAEVWLSFERHKGTGKVRLSQRFVKVVQTEKQRGMLAVVQASRGMMTTWTMIPQNIRYLNRQRVGKMMFGRGK